MLDAEKPAIGTTLDRLVLIGKELQTLHAVIKDINERSEEDMRARMNSVLSLAEDALQSIQHILEISWESRDDVTKPMWQKNFARQKVTRETLDELQLDRTADRLCHLRACIGVWIDRILENDVQSLCGLNLQLNWSYLTQHRIAEDAIREAISKAADELVAKKILTATSDLDTDTRYQATYVA